jgi:predicted porin
MKKSLLAAAVLSAVSFGAYADGVELYGTLDVAVASVAHQYGADSALQGNVNITGDKISSSKASIAGTFTGLVNGGVSPSRWGIKGSETIDGDLSAVFKAEQRFNATSGTTIDQLKGVADKYTPNVNGTTLVANNAAASSLSGQFFNAEAWVGLMDKNMGTLTFGRQYVATKDVIDLNDPVPAFQFSPTQYAGSLDGGMGITELLRQDNSIKYSNKMDNISYTLMYKFGNISGSNSAGSSYSANVMYKADKIKLALGYMGANDALSLGDATSTSAVGATAYNTNGYVFSVGYKALDNLEVKAGYQRWTLGAASNPSLVSQLVYAQGADGITVTSIAYTGVNKSSEVTWVGFDYGFSDKLMGMVGYYTRNDDAFGSTASGNINWLSALLNYQITKRTAVYVGGMAESYGGSYNGYMNNSIIATGMTHKF